jgi:hypothetical protein
MRQFGRTSEKEGQDENITATHEMCTQILQELSVMTAAMEFLKLAKYVMTSTMLVMTDAHHRVLMIINGSAYLTLEESQILAGIHVETQSLIHRSKMSSAMTGTM